MIILSMFFFLWDAGRISQDVSCPFSFSGRAWQKRLVRKTVVTQKMWPYYAINWSSTFNMAFMYPNWGGERTAGKRNNYSTKKRIFLNSYNFIRLYFHQDPVRQTCEMSMEEEGFTEIFFQLNFCSCSVFFFMC